MRVIYLIAGHKIWQEQNLKTKSHVFIDLSATKDKEEVNTAFSSEEKGRDTGLPSVFGKEKASKQILFVEKRG